LFVINNAAVFLAVGFATDRHQALVVALINYLWPTLTILLSLALLGRKATAWLVPGTLLAVLGVFLVLTHGASFSFTSLSHRITDNPAANGLAAIAALTWALYSTLTRRWTSPVNRGAAPLFILATGLVLFLMSLVCPETHLWSLRVRGEVAIFSVITGLAYVFWDIAMRQGDVLFVATCSYLTPLLSTAVSCLYLAIVPGVTLWAGCLLIITGSFLSWHSVNGHERAIVGPDQGKVENRLPVPISKQPADNNKPGNPETKP
jgi:drug/metabolite transporter (DMT)-like permease